MLFFLFFLFYSFIKKRNRSYSKITIPYKNICSCNSNSKVSSSLFYFYHHYRHRQFQFQYYSFCVYADSTFCSLSLDFSLMYVSTIDLYIDRFCLIKCSWSWQQIRVLFAKIRSARCPHVINDYSKILIWFQVRNSFWSQLGVDVVYGYAFRSHHNQFNSYKKVKNVKTIVNAICIVVLIWNYAELNTLFDENKGRLKWLWRRGIWARYRWYISKFNKESISR
jgi:hypothetical protein